MEALKQFWRWLTTSRYTRFLEEENARLHEMVTRLEQMQKGATPVEQRVAPSRSQIRSWSRMRRQLEEGAMDSQAMLERARQQRVAAHMRSILEE